MCHRILGVLSPARLLCRVCVDNLHGLRLVIIFELDRETDCPARGLVQLILQLGERYGDRLREPFVSGVCLHCELFMSEQFLILLV